MSRRARRSLRCLAALAGYALFSLLLFHEGLRSDRLFTPMHTERFEPWRSSTSDARQQELAKGEYPQASDKLISFRADDTVTVAALREGRLPLWNPFNAGGVPHLAMGLYGVFHPFHQLQRWMAPERAWVFLAILHHFLAAAFTFLWLRRIGCRAGAAFVGGLAFGFSLGLVARTHYYQYLESACWLPLGLWLVEGVFSRRRGARPLACLFGLALATAIVFAGGWPQLAVYVVAAWGIALLLRSSRVDLQLPGVRFAGAALMVLAICVAVAPYVGDVLLLYAFGPLAALLIAFLLGKDKGAFLKRLALFGGAAALGLGCIAVQYLPASEWMREFGARAFAAPETLVDHRLLPRFLAGLVLPDVFGVPTQPQFEMLANLVRVFALDASSIFARDVFGSPIENAMYVGLIPLVLAPIGLLSRSPRRMLLAVLLVVFGGFALGLRGIVYPAYFAGFFIGTDPRRALIVATFAACALGALGFARMQRSGRGAAALGAALFGAAIVALALGWLGSRDVLTAPFAAHARAIGDALGDASAVPDSSLRYTESLVRGALLRFGAIGGLSGIAIWLLSRRTLRMRWIAAPLVLAADLCLAAQPYVGTQPADGFFSGHPLIDHLRAKLGLDGRIAHFEDGGAPGAISVPIPPNFAGVYGLRDAWCYTVSPPRRYQLLANALFPGASIVGNTFIPPLTHVEQLGQRALDYMNVRAIVGFGAVPATLPAGIALDATFGRAYVLDNQDALPRAFCAARALDVRADAPDSIRSRMLSAAFDPRAQVLIERDADFAHGGDVATLPTARVASDDRETLTIDLEGNGGAAWLVVLDTYADGWTAQVDGVDAPVLLADLAFRAVPIPAGAKQVVMRYAPRSVRIGVAVSLGSLAIAALGLLASLMMRRASAPESR